MLNLSSIWEKFDEIIEFGEEKTRLGVLRIFGMRWCVQINE